MKINIHENTLRVLDEEGNVLKTSVSEFYLIYPSEGKSLRNKKTGYTTNSYVGVGHQSELTDYEEV